MTRRILPVLMILSITATVVPPAFAAGSQPDVNFKIYSPGDSSSESKDAAPADNGAAAQPAETPATPAVTTAAPAEGAAESSAETKTPAAADSTPAADASSAEPAADKTDAQGQKIASKVLQGYIRVVPSGTKIPIIMDTAVDSDTSQEGDEFSARTSEDLTIDGGIVVPAGSVIKGRIAQLNAAKRFDRSGSVALKFDSVTTPDNKQIPIVANIVARGGVVHAKRGMKDIAIETGMVTLPTAAGLGIGLLAGNASKSSSIGAAGGAVIGAAVGVAVGVIILCAKKGKRVDVRPGDELKIELAEDLRMPM